MPPTNGVPTLVVRLSRYPSSEIPLKNPRTVPFLIVMFCRSVALIPNALVPGPAARPPSFQPLRSRITLLVWMSIALPVVMAVTRCWVKQ